MALVRLAFAVLVLAVLVPASHPSRSSAQPSVCGGPQLLLVIDKSSSMLGGLPGGMTKWQAATTAIGEVTGLFEHQIQFGLSVFPFPNRCGPGQIILPMGSNSGASIVDALGDPPPRGGNYTPMAETLFAAADHLRVHAARRDTHLVLITDGWQWCDPYDVSTRFTPVEGVVELRDLGVTVHVVGFGAAVDSLTLNRSAVAAGTALVGCNATNEDPAATDQCYHQADDLTELRAALSRIALTITDELCDGLDNDCDLRIDEGYDHDADGYTTCGSLVGRVDPALTDCEDADEHIHPGAAEQCDGVDNDCDGTIDSGCLCFDGESRPCGPMEGACEQGTQTCVEGAWATCEDAIGPASEACDGDDEDCDATIDEDARCGAGEICVAGSCETIAVDTPSPSESDPGPPDEAEMDAPTEPADAGTSEAIDAGPTPPAPGPDDGGCGCHAAGLTHDHRAAAVPVPAALAVLLAALAITVVRRRPR